MSLKTSPLVDTQDNEKVQGGGGDGSVSDAVALWGQHG